MNLYVIKADITTLPLDAIVNSTNRWMIPGGGVDGAIGRAAGPELLDAMVRTRGCKVGSAIMTKGFRLPAQYVIHAAGPDCRITLDPEEQDTLLRSTYHACLNLAQEFNLKSIAFPAISTGLYRFPIQRACCVAVEAVKSFDYVYDMDIYFVAFDEVAEEAYFKALEQ